MAQSKAAPSPEIAALHSQCEALQREIQHLDILQRISQDLVSEVDIDELLHSILRSAIEVVEAGAGSLILLADVTDELVFRVVEGGGGKRLQGRHMPRHQGIAGWVLDNQEAVIVDDTQQDQRFNPEVARSVDYAATGMICVPMTVRGEPIGVLQILNKQGKATFDGADKDVLLTFAAQSAIAIRNAQLYQELREERDRIVAAEEDVRKELARDLHDGPTQLVAAIIMNLDFARRLMDCEPDRADAELDQVKAHAERAMHQLRTMLFDLRPVILETKGLIPALEAYSTRLTDTERFAVHLEVDGEIPPLTKQAGSAIFAVIQEAISNARKHTQAQNIWLRVERQDDTLSVAVRDDGRGFNVSQMRTNYESRGSLGMINMDERAEMIQGSFSIDSAVGAGTTVRLVAPLAPNVE